MPRYDWSGLAQASSAHILGPSMPFQSTRDETSPSNPAQSSIKKMIWWRFRGPSAIAPGESGLRVALHIEGTCTWNTHRWCIGLKRVTLKVRLDDHTMMPSTSRPLAQPEQAGTSPMNPGYIVYEGGMPRRDLTLHLLDIFLTHFGCQYPALSRSQLERDLDQRSGSTLLFNCIASAASR